MSGPQTALDLSSFSTLFPPMAFLWLTSLIHATHTIFVSSVANGNERVQTEGHGNPVEFSRYEPTQWEEALQIKVLSDEKKRSESEKPSDSVFILGWIATESVLWSVRQEAALAGWLWCQRWRLCRPLPVAAVKAARHVCTKGQTVGLGGGGGGGHHSLSSVQIRKAFEHISFT